MWISCPLVLLLGLAAGCASTTPYRPFLPGTEPVHVLAVRILRWDGSTPVPVAGARVSGWTDPSHDAELPVSQLVAEGWSDAHGFVNVTWDPDAGAPFHWLAEAPGLAVRNFSPDGNGDVFLAPGAPYRLRVLAPSGAPLAGAHVEYFIYGCPHAPAARTGTTDRDGLVVLEDLPADAREMRGQLWIVAEGAAPGPYYTMPTARAGQLATLRTEPGRTAHGVVRGADGRAKRNVLVRALGYPRGPVTETDDNGRFRIVGVTRGRNLAFYDPADPLDTGPSALVEGFDEVVPIRLTLPAGRATFLGDGEESSIVEVEVNGRESAAANPSPLDDVPVRFVRRTDGLGFEAPTADGRLRAKLPPGRYRITVGDGNAATREVDVPASERVRFTLDDAARREPDATEAEIEGEPEPPDRDGFLRVLAADGSPARGVSLEWGPHGRQGNELQDDDGRFPLADAPDVSRAVVRGDDIYPLPVALPEEGSADVRLPAGRIVVRLRDAAGRPLDSVAYLDHVSLRRDGDAHALGAVPAGAHTLIVGAKGHVGRVRTIRLKEGAEQVVDLVLAPRAN